MIKPKSQQNKQNTDSRTSLSVMCLRPSVLGQDQSETKKNVGLGLARLVLCCETRSCHARRHNDLEGHNNFSSNIYSFSILFLEHHYCEDQQWRSPILRNLIHQVPLFTSNGFGPKNFVFLTSLFIFECHAGLQRNFAAL